MNPQRCATVAAALTVVLAGWVVAWLAGFGSAGRERRRSANPGPPRIISHYRCRACGRTAGNRNGQRRY